MSQDTESVDLTEVEFGRVTEALHNPGGRWEEQIDVSAKRWTKYGHDRLYLNGDIGYQQTSAYVDLQTGEFGTKEQPVGVKRSSVELRDDELVVEWTTNSSYQIVVSASHDISVGGPATPREVDLAAGTDVVSEREAGEDSTEVDDSDADTATGAGDGGDTSFLSGERDGHGRRTATDGGSETSREDGKWTLRQLSTVVGEFDDLGMVTALDWFGATSSDFWILNESPQQTVARWRDVSASRVSQAISDAQDATGVESPDELDEDLFKTPTTPGREEGWATPPYLIGHALQLGGVFSSTNTGILIDWLVTREDGEDAARQASRRGISTELVEKHLSEAEELVGETVADRLPECPDSVPDDVSGVSVDDPSVLDDLPDGRDREQIGSVLDVCPGDIIEIDPPTWVVKRTEPREKNGETAIASLAANHKTETVVHAAVTGETNSRQPFSGVPHWWEHATDISPTPLATTFDLDEHRPGKFWVNVETGEWQSLDETEVGDLLTRPPTVGVVTGTGVKYPPRIPLHFPVNVGEWSGYAQLDELSEPAQAPAEEFGPFRIAGANHVARVGHVSDVEEITWTTDDSPEKCGYPITETTERFFVH